MRFKTELQTFGALGTGAIGSGWIAPALATGLAGGDAGHQT